MANTLSKGRLLLVTSLVMALLSYPLGSQAGSQNESPIQIQSLSTSIVGLSFDVDIQAEPYSQLEIKIEKPSKQELVFQAISDNKGQAQLTIDPFHLQEAGNYEIEARNISENGSFGFTQAFYLYTGSLDTNSQVTVQKSVGAIGETLLLEVQLTDQYKNPIEGHVLKAITSSETVGIYSSEFASDKNGEMEFFITGYEAGISEITLFDSSANKSLVNTPKVAFTDESGFKEVGGHTYQSQSVYLSAESGAINGFRIEGLESGSMLGENTSVSVTAIDESGITVTDYTGTIRFSSTDSGASLPSDYNFLAEDQGTHDFDLSFKFISPGEQSLSVTDINQSSIQSEDDFEVLSDSEINFDSDFVSNEYNREGDFELLSPSSGTYSSSSLVIQGEASYGFSAIIYLNDEMIDHTDVTFEEDFEFDLKDIPDGDHELYVEIAELYIEDEDSELVVISVSETSSIVDLSIDTTAPELFSIETSPAREFSPGESFMIEVLSESDLDEVSIILNGQVTQMDEASTSGKYEALLIAPTDLGDYGVDVFLMDTLGNEVQYRDQLILTVSQSTDTSDSGNTGDSENPDTTDNSLNSSTSDTTTLSKDALPETITGLTATPSEQAVILSWESAESANAIAYYRVYYGPSSDSLFAISDTFDSSTSWIITNLVGDQIYYFSVSAIDIQGNEGEQSNVSLGIPTPGPETTIEIPMGGDDVPLLTDTSNLPNKVPETGAGSMGILGISFLSSGAYCRLRKKRN
jgi:hypothetical protein